MNLKEYFKQKFISILSEQEETLTKPDQGKVLPTQMRKPSNGFSSHYNGGRTRAQTRTSIANQKAKG